MDRLLSDLTDGLPEWAAIPLVIVVVGGGWFGIWRLFRWAHARGDRVQELRDQRAWAKAQQPVYAHGPQALAAHPEAFALAASAWLAHAQGRQPADELAYRATPFLPERVLARLYEVGSPDALVPRLQMLLVEGHRTFPHGDEHGEIDLMAWDLVRVIDLARIGLGVGVLDEPTALATMRFAARALQDRFDRWDAFGAQLERGYRHTHEQRSAHAERLADVECGGYRRMLTSPTGPWSVVPWTTRIGPGDLRILDGADVTPGPLLEAWEQPIRERLQRG